MAAVQQIMAQQLMGVQQQQQAGGLTAGGTASLAGGLADVAAITLDRKQREAYVGNLAVGVITKELLEEFFNQALSHMMKDPIATPPVININMDAQGRFAFVEFRTRELANQSMMMDKLVEVHGRHLHVGRPKGYLEPTGPPLPLEIAAPQAPRDPDATAAAGGGGGAGQGASSGVALSIDGQVPTNVLLLSNILPIKFLREEEDRKILELEVKEEANKHSNSVEAVVVPPPPSTAQDRGPGRAYIRYATLEEAVKGRKVFHTRTLDDNVIKAWFVQPTEFDLAARGEWMPRQHSVAGIALPGLYTIAPLVSGISGLTALNPALASLWHSNPNISIALEKGIDPDEVPFEEGWVKLRGFPPVVTKQHIVEFFKDCGEVKEEDIKMVHSADGTSLGEAFVKIGGEKAKLRLALGRDKALLPPVKVPAEVLTSFEEDLQRRVLSGCVLV
jgi:splicing factor U2AF 65 kDa subunit